MSAVSSRDIEYTVTAPEALSQDPLKDRVSAVGFYAAAAIRFLERDDPQVEQALAGLRRLMDQTRLAADHFK